MNSYLYVGQVRHRRSSPREHQFSYTLFMLCLDLDELPGLFRPYWLWSSEHFNLAWFRRADHLGDPQQQLGESVRDRVEQETGHRPTGRIFLLTHLRYLGFGFNPVSFYYCYNQNGQLHTIVAEVSNTPWGERFEYVFQANASGHDTDADYYTFNKRKSFHVSPFMPMNIDYHWHVSQPCERLNVLIENWRNGSRIFDASLDMKRRPINRRSLAGVLIQFPLMTAKIILAIYFEAFRLWIKKVPFYPHSSEPGKG